MNQTTNIRRILDRVMRHPMMRELPFETAIEYAVDFLELMGTPALYDEKTAIVEVHDWRGNLPCDFKDMIQVRTAGSQHTRRWLDCCGQPGFLGATYRYSGHSFHMSDLKPNEFYTGELTYKTQGMVIFTSTKDVDVEIAYHGFAVDEEGFPLLPDNASLLRGLENYIKLQWFTIQFDMGKISQQVFANAQQEYTWSAGDAQNEFSRLDLDKAETLFNAFKTMLPRNHEHSRSFFTNGSAEVFLQKGPTGFVPGAAAAYVPGPSASMPSPILPASGARTTGGGSSSINLSGKEDSSNKVTSLSPNSTDKQYPTAKCVFDFMGGYKQWVGTQSEYDQLTPSDDTIYFIMDD